jgi:hypothetical protein
MRFLSFFQRIKAVTIFVLSCFIIPAMAQAQTNHAFRVTLDGDWYLQAGDVLNQSDPEIYIIGLTYSTGPFREGGAVFEHYLATGMESQLLPGYPNHYGTHQWAFDQITPGDRFYFQGLDLDNFLVGLVPDGIVIDDVGGSMTGAYVEVQFSDGFYKRLSLNSTPWMQTQILQFTDRVSPVPEPSEAAMMILGLAMLGAHRRRQKR